MDDLTFDEETHTYRIAGRVVPSVTQVIRDLLPGWEAAEWYLQRGTAVHACAAMIAHGKAFTHDPQIDGQVKACRAWFRDMSPEILAVEEIVYHKTLLYAGRYDLLARIDGKLALVDYKASHDADRTRIQLGGYALAMDPGGPVFGYEVVLGEDGRYNMSERLDLRAGRREFAALLGAYKIRERWGKK